MNYLPVYDVVWQRALVLADGQRGRLQPQPDGSVLVVNSAGFDTSAWTQPKRRKSGKRNAASAK